MPPCFALRPRADRPGCRPAAWSRLGALLPDTRCRLCALPSRAPLCSACQCAYALDPGWRCPRCALPLAAAASCCGRCALHPPAWDRAIAWADYAAPLDRLVAQIKFGGDAALARWLGRLLGQRLGAAWPPQWPAAALVLPVPLAAARLRSRGYNQAWEIARGVAASLHWRADCRRLSRRRESPAQSSLPLARRAANVRGAFVAEGLPPGRPVLLVDDVMTSGSTAEHATRALLRAGSGPVLVAVLLRTPPQRTAADSA